MSIIQSVRETHPYRLLLMGTLIAVVLVQMVALAWIVRGQVRQAELRELQARSAAHATTATASSRAVPASQGQGGRRDGLVQAVYVRHP
ncbi:hypothetical protein GCM10023165_21750 [Variovorax defluvii]|uniref:Uncharacterized protein n=1 Tax=Variovorax defluvii TaxID=913761 RepID=A0ABP8HM87_9BURK